MPGHCKSSDSTNANVPLGDVADVVPFDWLSSRRTYSNTVYTRLYPFDVSWLPSCVKKGCIRVTSEIFFAIKSTHRKPKEDDVRVLKVFAFLPQMGREPIPFFPSISASMYLQAFLTSVSFSRLLPSSHHLLRLCHWRISLRKRLWQGFS